MKKNFSVLFILAFVSLLTVVIIPGVSADPEVHSLSQTAGPVAGGTILTITGEGFSGATAVDFDITPATSYTVDSDTQITATTPAHSAGSVDILVTAGGITSEPVSSDEYFYSNPPTITSISPAFGPLGGGDEVTIIGTNFIDGGFPVSGVTFDGVDADLAIIDDDTHIRAISPIHGAGAVNVVVTAAGGAATKTGGYTYVAAPEFTSISPVSGPAVGGTPVAITGTNFISGDTFGVTIGGVAATAVSRTDATHLAATTPAGIAGVQDVVITTSGGTATGTGEYTYVPAPIFTSITPNIGPVLGGTSVTIVGSNFVSGGSFGVTIGGVSATGVTRTDTMHITATTPAGTAGARDVIITNNDGQTVTGTGAFTYGAAPTLSGVSPASGPVTGVTNVTITGANLIGTTGMTFGGTAATNVSVFSATQVNATTPAHAAGAIDVVVTTPNGTATGTGAYTYNAVPTIASVAPSSGPVTGVTNVTITGTNLLGASGVTFGGTAATNVSVFSATQVNATTPAHAAGVVDVIITTPNGTATGAGAYTYIAISKIGVFRNGIWLLDLNGNNVWDGSVTDRMVGFGASGDLPVVGDWNHDGTNKIGVYRSPGVWILDYNGNNAWDGSFADRIYGFGASGDIPVVGDWNHDGFKEIGLFRNGVWLLDYNGNGVWDGSVTDRMVGFGAIGDIPVVGDWNHDGTDKMGLLRSPGVWILDYNGNNAWDGTPTDKMYGFGASGDKPVVADWSIDGTEKIGVYRSPGVWIADYNGNNAWDGTPTDKMYGFGAVGDLPTIGKWI